jgi:hypothetical protein
MIKMPVTWGVLTIWADIRDAVFCIAEMDKAAAAGEPGNPSEAMLGGVDPGPSSSKKRSFPEPTAMVCEGVGPAPRKGKLVGEVELSKKVPLGDGTTAPSPLVPLSPPNRKAHSSPSFWRTLTCLHWNHQISLGFQGR